MTARPPETLSRPAAVCSSAPGRARVDVEDAGADLDGLGLRGEVAHQRGGVEAVGLGDPDRVQARLLEPGDLVGRLTRVPGVDEGHGELHNGSCRSGSVGRPNCDRITVTMARSPSAWPRRGGAASDDVPHRRDRRHRPAGQGPGLPLRQARPHGRARLARRREGRGGGRRAQRAARLVRRHRRRQRRRLRGRRRGAARGAVRRPRRAGRHRCRSTARPSSPA